MLTQQMVALDRAPLPDALPGTRLDALDGLRAVAILLVMGSHYFSRWTPPHHDVSLYPYGSRFAEFFPFAYGHLGVGLFFLISGFVIRLTLQRSADAGSFAMRRWARLFPAMLVCSLVTFAFASWSGLWVFAPRTPLDLLPGLTFLHPVFWRTAFGLELQAMDWAYWSLFVEAIFYALAALLWFGAGCGRARGWRSSLALGLVGLALLGRLGLGLGASGAWQTAIDYLLLPAFLPWLAAGVAVYELRAAADDRAAGAALASSALCIAFDGAMIGGADLLARALVVGVFLLGAMRPQTMGLLRSKPMQRIGCASYPLFLLHQNIGVSVIAHAPHRLGSGWLAVIVPLLVAGFFVISALCLYRWWEEPVRRALLRVAPPQRLAV